MPDSPDPSRSGADQSASATLATRLVTAQRDRAPIAAPGLADMAAARAIRDQVIAQAIAEGDHRLGFRTAAGVDGLLTGAMQFTADLVLPGDRLIAGEARPALAFRVARAIEPDTPAAEMPPALGAIALAIDIADHRYDQGGAGATAADRLADNGGAAAFVIGPWRAITGSFADCELMLQGTGQGCAATLFADPVAEALALARRRQQEGDRIAEGSLLLIVADVAPLRVAAGTHLTLAAPTVGTITAEISG
jgi:2-keto-4-pentenoate hydratase